MTNQKIIITLILRRQMWQLDNVSSVYVAETKTMPQYFPDDVPNDGTTYEEEQEIDFSAEEFEVPEEGVAFVQHNYGLMSRFCLEVNDDEEFSIESLQIIDGGNTIVYKGDEYSCAGQDGDDNGEVEIYVDGELLECCEQQNRRQPKILKRVSK